MANVTRQNDPRLVLTHVQLRSNHSLERHPMTNLILALVAFVALLGMIRKNTFQTFPVPSRWLAIGLALILVTNSLGWFTTVYLSRTLTMETFATAHIVISAITAATSAIAFVLVIAAVFASRQPNGVTSIAQG